MPDYYSQDLAYIHDSGFNELAQKAAEFILNIFSCPCETKRLFDLGCGAGNLAEKFYQAGFNVAGIDISPDMILRAKRRVPRGEFKVGSIFSVKLPSCSIVTSTGECLNYQFDEENNLYRVGDLFKRVYDSLEEKGIFVFDLLEPCQIKNNERMRSFKRGPDWFVLVEKYEDKSSSILVREIIE